MTRLCAVFVIVGCVLLAAPAEAALIMSATIGGQDFCASDNDLGPCTHGTMIPDANPTLGQLALGTTTTPLVLAGAEVFGTLSVQTLGPPQNILDSSSLSITNISGAPLVATVAIGATDYPPPSTVAFLSGAGVWQNAEGSTIAMTWHNDPANAQGAEDPGDRPGTLLATFAHTASLISPTDAFATGVLGPFAVDDPLAYAMTLGFDLTLVPGGQLLNRGQNLVKPVPEPATLALLGVAGVGLYLRRRRL